MAVLTLLLGLLFWQAPNPPGGPAVVTFNPLTTITASLGDGTSCTISKGNTAAILASFGCVSGDALTFISPAVVIGGGASRSIYAGLGDVICLLGTNPTSAALTMGSLGIIPAGGLAWSCSTNIRTLDVVTGQTVPVAGSVTWP